jgi:two-component system, OmpR family, sensor kinase
LDRTRTITTSVPELTALGDRDALKQVLLILLDNALKHTQGEVAVQAETSGGEARISVCDQGPGIPPDQIAHIFDRFYRGEADRQAPGFGLGLPIARALIEGQGGRIQLESQVDQGTRVQLFLPQPSP